MQRWHLGYLIIKFSFGGEYFFLKQNILSVVESHNTDMINQRNGINKGFRHRSLT